MNLSNKEQDDQFNRSNNGLLANNSLPYIFALGYRQLFAQQPQPQPQPQSRSQPQAEPQKKSAEAKQSKPPYTPHTRKYNSRRNNIKVEKEQRI